MKPKKNLRKLGELIVYISRLSEGDPRFGALKLNKLLFYCDFYSFLYFGKWLTEDTYQKLSLGPAPKHLLPIQRRLKKEKAIDILKVDYHGRTQQKTVALRDPNLELFKPEEIDLINQIVKDFWDKSGTEISNVSHRFIGWEAAKLGEEIPRNVILAHRRELTTQEINYGHNLEPMGQKR